jgi:hypothetical protein
MSEDRSNIEKEASSEILRRLDLREINEKIMRFLQPGPRDRLWVREGFSVYRTINNLNGPLIELGGPTDEGYKQVDLSKLDKRLFVSNLLPGFPYYDTKTGEFLGYRGKIDFQADATAIPIKNEGCGALFVSCLPVEIRKKILSEAYRVLEKGGLLIWQGGIDKDIEIAEKLGFEVMEYLKQYDRDSKLYFWDVIFQKK